MVENKARIISHDVWKLYENVISMSVSSVIAHSLVHLHVCDSFLAAVTRLEMVLQRPCKA